MAALKKAAQYFRLVFQDMRSAVHMTSRPLISVATRRQHLTAPDGIPAYSLFSKFRQSVLSKTSPRTIHRQTHTFPPSSVKESRDTKKPKQHTTKTDPPSTEQENTSSPSSAQNTTKTVLKINEKYKSTYSLLGKFGKHLPPNIRKYNDTNFTTSEENATQTTPHSYLSVPESTEEEEEARRMVAPVFHPRAESGFGDVTSASGRPLVVLFPWRGSTGKLRAKYSQVYQEMGLDVLCLSEGMSVTRCSVPHLIRTVTGQVLHVLQDQCGPFSNRPILFHCMSGGYMFAGSLLMNAAEQAHDTQHASTHPNNTQTYTPPHSDGIQTCKSPFDGNTQTYTPPHSEDSQSHYLSHSDHVSNKMSYYYACPPDNVLHSKQTHKMSPSSLLHPRQHHAPTKDTTTTTTTTTKTTTTNTNNTTTNTINTTNNNQSPPPAFHLPRSAVSQNSEDYRKSGDLRNQIIGMVLDCPVLTPYLARRGIDISVRNSLQAFLLRTAMSVFSPILDPVYDSYGQAMVALDKSPKLVLLSDVDYLCPVSLVRGVVSELEDQGVSVRVRVIPGADHVRLLGKDPEKYRSEILQFLQSLGVCGLVSA
ncbi:hypothetical protein ACOMHN_005627 [Nucella lapillus]